MLYLAVRGAGDGGIGSTAADVRGLWTSLLDGRIVPRDTVAEMIRPHSDAPAGRAPVRARVLLHPTTEAVMLTGHDAGVSFRSVHDPTEGSMYTGISNTSEGAWTISEAVEPLDW